MTHGALARFWMCGLARPARCQRRPSRGRDVLPCLVLWGSRGAHTSSSKVRLWCPAPLQAAQTRLVASPPLVHANPALLQASAPMLQAAQPLLPLPGLPTMQQALMQGLAVLGTSSSGASTPSTSELQVRNGQSGGAVGRMLAPLGAGTAGRRPTPSCARAHRSAATTGVAMMHARGGRSKCLEPCC